MLAENYAGARERTSVMQDLRESSIYILRFSSRMPIVPEIRAQFIIELTGK